MIPYTTNTSDFQRFEKACAEAYSTATMASTNADEEGKQLANLFAKLTNPKYENHFSAFANSKTINLIKAYIDGYKSVGGWNLSEAYSHISTIDDGKITPDQNRNRRLACLIPMDWDENILAAFLTELKLDEAAKKEVVDIRESYRTNLQTLKTLPDNLKPIFNKIKKIFDDLGVSS